MQNNKNWQKDDKRMRKYYGSEAMSLDVLEAVCDGVSGTTNGRALLMMHSKKNDKAPKSEARETGRSLEGYCQTLLEEYEEEIKEKMFAKDQHTSLGQWLCLDQTGTCSQKTYSDL